MNGTKFVAEEWTHFNWAAVQRAEGHVRPPLSPEPATAPAAPSGPPRSPPPIQAVPSSKFDPKVVPLTPPDHGVGSSTSSQPSPMPQQDRSGRPQSFWNRRRQLAQESRDAAASVHRQRLGENASFGTMPGNPGRLQGDGEGALRAIAVIVGIIVLLKVLSSCAKQPDVYPSTATAPSTPAPASAPPYQYTPPLVGSGWSGTASGATGSNSTGSANQPPSAFPARPSPPLSGGGTVDSTTPPSSRQTPQPPTGTGGPGATISRDGLTLTPGKEGRSTGPAKPTDDGIDVGRDAGRDTSRDGRSDPIMQQTGQRERDGERLMIATQRNPYNGGEVVTYQRFQATGGAVIEVCEYHEASTQSGARGRVYEIATKPNVSRPAIGVPPDILNGAIALCAWTHRP